MEKEIKWVNPLPGCNWGLPLGKYQTGGFGAKRKYNLHSGVDLHCKHLQPLASVEAGVVVKIIDFGNKDKNPKLNETRAIFVEGDSGVVVYCNVMEREDLRPGIGVAAGEVIGKVIKINKSEKNEVCMLHLELYRSGTRKRVIWSYQYPKPDCLLDPSNYLISTLTYSNK
jgi:murein DD-endopeptidase MepM/ murein hydrolase activator NlpD